jgi:ribosomal protein RSM22 (predicted rRNA methylase)
MHLPQELRAAVEQEIARAEPARLAAASTQLSRQYKAGDFSSPAIQTDAQRAAYLAVRLPATYAAAWHVFSELRHRAPEVQVRSILDLGTGPGTAVLAARQVFGELSAATLLESDSAWIAAGKRIADASPGALPESARWIRHDLGQSHSADPHDLVVIAYALGELHQAQRDAVLKQAWSLCTRFLVVIEPGTVRGFSVINAARSALIAQDAHLLAPCPHQGPCPMAAGGDWCHFAQRLERTSLHRRLKGGDLGHEDEKFSYIIGSKTAADAAKARIVRHPMKHGGHVKLALCTPAGLEAKTVTRSQKQAYKLARQAVWGQTWEE